MSVKGKVKRANKRITELEEENRTLKQDLVVNKEIQNIKDNYIKSILYEYMLNYPNYSDTSIVVPVSAQRLDMMSNAKLCVERDCSNYNVYNLRLKL